MGEYKVALVATIGRLLSEGDCEKYPKNEPETDSYCHLVRHLQLFLIVRQIMAYKLVKDGYSKISSSGLLVCSMSLVDTVEVSSRLVVANAYESDTISGLFISSK